MIKITKSKERSSNKLQLILFFEQISEGERERERRRVMNWRIGFLGWWSADPNTSDSVVSSEWYYGWTQKEKESFGQKVNQIVLFSLVHHLFIRPSSHSDLSSNNKKEEPVQCSVILSSSKKGGVTDRRSYCLATVRQKVMTHKLTLESKGEDERVVWKRHEKKKEREKVVESPSIFSFSWPKSCRESWTLEELVSFFLFCPRHSHLISSSFSLSFFSWMNPTTTPVKIFLFSASFQRLQVTMYTKGSNCSLMITEWLRMSEKGESSLQQKK